MYGLLEKANNMQHGVHFHIYYILHITCLALYKHCGAKVLNTGP